MLLICDYDNDVVIDECGVETIKEDSYRMRHYIVLLPDVKYAFHYHFVHYNLLTSLMCCIALYVYFMACVANKRRHVILVSISLGRNNLFDFVTIENLRACMCECS